MSILFGPRLLGIKEFNELPLKLFGSELASALAAIDQAYIVIADCCRFELRCDLCRNASRHVRSAGHWRADLSLWRWHDVGAAHSRQGVVSIYTVGRTFLLELLLAEMRNHRVRFADSAKAPALTTNWWHLSPSSARAVLSTNARRAGMTISPCLSPCWPGPPSICISMPGPARSSTSTGPIGRGKTMVGEPSVDEDTRRLTGAVYQVDGPRHRRQHPTPAAIKYATLQLWYFLDRLSGLATHLPRARPVLGRLVCTRRSRICRIQFLKLLRIKYQ